MEWETPIHQKVNGVQLELDSGLDAWLAIRLVDHQSIN